MEGAERGKIEIFLNAEWAQHTAYHTPWKHPDSEPPPTTRILFTKFAINAFHAGNRKCLLLPLLGGMLNHRMFPTVPTDWVGYVYFRRRELHFFFISFVFFLTENSPVVHGPRKKKQKKKREKRKSRCAFVTLFAFMGRTKPIEFRFFLSMSIAHAPEI